MYIIPYSTDLQKIGAFDKITVLVPSSSGPGRLVLIQKIEGSTPSEITNLLIEPADLAAIFIAVIIDFFGKIL